MDKDEIDYEMIQINFMVDNLKEYITFKCITAEGEINSMDVTRSNYKEYFKIYIHPPNIEKKEINLKQYINFIQIDYPLIIEKQIKENEMKIDTKREEYLTFQKKKEKGNNVLNDADKLKIKSLRDDFDQATFNLSKWKEVKKINRMRNLSVNSSIEFLLLIFNLHIFRT
tara:strand:+ start:4607 stop:5116 length:510 start_codon:yes stop_codon:yes gene_type:complete